MTKYIYFGILFLNFIQLNNAATCPPVCMIFCEHGNVLDLNGCPTCRCNPEPICKPVFCGIGCHNGFAKGKDGCEICACAPTVCNPVGCKLLCRNGWKKDDFGCDKCECNDDPKANCAGRVCPEGFYCKAIEGKCPEAAIPEFPCTPTTRWMCAKICPLFKCMPCNSGYVIDKFGCQTCTCKNPCERNDCITGEKCVPASTASRYRCVPSCSCPKVVKTEPICRNIWNPCTAGCPRGTRCCNDNGCNSCYKCN